MSTQLLERLLATNYPSSLVAMRFFAGISQFDASLVYFEGLDGDAGKPVRWAAGFRREVHG